MKWVKIHVNKPIADVDVHVVTKSGKRGTARYWPEIKKWFTSDAHLPANDEVIKWKYEDAKTSEKHKQPYKDLKEN